mgnify:CR=1 FL=1
MSEPTRRVAVIDLGSNTAKMVAVEYEPSRRYRVIDQLREVVRLSEGMGHDLVLRADAMERALATLTTFSDYCRAAGIDRVIASATSAVRDAVNGPAFVGRVALETGIELTTLSGEEEAAYGVLAVANSTRYEDAVVLDLGGGSVQLSLMRERRSHAGRSWPFGAVRATERFLGQEPPKKKAIKALRDAVRDEVGPWLETQHPLSDVPWVGMGGTLRNLANAWQKHVQHPLDLLHEYELPREALSHWAETLPDMDLSERASVPGLNADRADIVVAGAVVLDEIASLAGLRSITMSGEGLREGLVYPVVFEHEPGHLAPDVRTFSVLNLLRTYHERTGHPERVHALATSLFDALAGELDLTPEDRELLAAAALLHDIGMSVDYYGHHKHGAYLIGARPLAGFDHREQAIIAMVVKAHRKGKPSLNGYGSLLKDRDEALVRHLAGILRVAEQLDRSRAGRVVGTTVHVGETTVQIEVHSASDANLEVQEAGARAGLLAESLGKRVELVPVPTGDA